MNKIAKLLYILILLPTSLYAEMRGEDLKIAQTILNKFSAHNIQMSDFVQTSAGGKVSHGTFYLKRPGRIRFVYKDLPLNVVADGKSVLINNSLVNSWNIYPLDKTPMKILLAHNISADSGYLYDVQYQNNDVILIFKTNPNNNSAIYMDFNAKNYKLKNWTIVDEQNKATRIDILNENYAVRFNKDMFAIPYQTISMKRR